MIIFQLLPAPETSTHGWGWVVDNPTNCSMAFCLPVAVLAFNGDLIPPAFVTKTGHTYAELLGTPKVKTLQKKIPNTGPPSLECNLSPFWWKWQDDSHQFVAYAEKTNQDIEIAYDLFRQDPTTKDNFILLRGIVRFVDDTPTDYRIDFRTNVQTRIVTGYTRRVNREKSNVVLPKNAEWQFYHENNMWVKYEFLVQLKLEEYFERYVNRNGVAVFQFQTPGRPEIYQISFITETQTNTQSGNVRRIRRQTIST